MNSRIFGRCVDCTKSQTSRRQMLAEAGRGDEVGIAYWQAVLRRACRECEADWERRWTN